MTQRYPHTIIVSLLIALAVGVSLLWVTDAGSAPGPCLFSESGEWQLACTADRCVICQQGECRQFRPSQCGGIE